MSSLVGYKELAPIKMDVMRLAQANEHSSSIVRRKANHLAEMLIRDQDVVCPPRQAGWSRNQRRMYAKVQPGREWSDESKE